MGVRSFLLLQGWGRFSRILATDGWEERIDQHQQAFGYVCLKAIRNKRYRPCNRPLSLSAGGGWGEGNSLTGQHFPPPNLPPLGGGV
jgi:hypothetical protein